MSIETWAILIVLALAGCFLCAFVVICALILGSEYDADI